MGASDVYDPQGRKYENIVDEHRGSVNWSEVFSDLGPITAKTFEVRMALFSNVPGGTHSKTIENVYWPLAQHAYEQEIIELVDGNGDAKLLHYTGGGSN